MSLGRLFKESFMNCKAPMSLSRHRLLYKGNVSIGKTQKFTVSSGMAD